MLGRLQSCSRGKSLATQCTGASNGASNTPWNQAGQSQALESGVRPHGASNAANVQQLLRRAARRQRGEAGSHACIAEDKTPSRRPVVATPAPPQQPLNPVHRQQPKQRQGLHRARLNPVHRHSPAWDKQLASVPGLRERFVPARRNPQLPKMSSLIIVEGWTDAQAVQRAVNAAVYVCDGDSVRSSHAHARLQALCHWRPGEIIILTDPDAGGRMLRIFLDDAFRQMWNQCTILHAFVPIYDAIGSVANSRHDVGSIGVENAAPQAILSSLEAAAPSYYPRQEFSQVELMEAGFINAFNTKQVLGAKLRREVLCRALGIDSCTGSALITALNRFFTREQYEHAVSQAEAAVARQRVGRQER